MAYTPSRLIIRQKNQFTESQDLSVTLGSLGAQEVFLQVIQNKTAFVLDLAKILLFESGLDYTQSVTDGLTSRLTDFFVTKYSRDDIPVRNDNGFYTKRLKVFNPTNYKDHKVQFTSINTPEIVDDITKKGFLDDLVVTTRSNVTNYLAAVNGVFHKTAVHEDKLYILDGFRTIRLTDRDDITLVDTTPLGGHTIIPLTSENVALDSYNGVATVSTEMSLKNKTVFFVIDGYFYHQETQIFYHADDTHLKLYTNKLPLIEQFRHNPRTIYRQDRYGADATQRSRKYTDGYDAVFLGKRVVSTDQFKTKEFQYSRLTGFHSFLVVIDNPSIFPVNYELIPTGTPQFYRDHATRMLSGMLSYSVGACPSYLILRDPFGRKSIYIEKQNYDLNLQRDSVSPSFIPSLVENIEESADLPIRMIDYISA